MMPRRRTAPNGLQAALHHLIEAQALAQLQHAKTEERFSRIDERFARMEERMARMEATLAALVHLIEQLPDAVKDKIGFAKPPTTTTTG